MKKIIIIVIINIVYSLTFVLKAQDKLAKLTSTNISDISNYVSTNFQLKQHTLDTLCLYTTVFVKFKVSGKGEIDDLTLTETTPGIIKTELKKAIKSSNGHWSTLKNDKEYFSNKIFILPIVLFYGKGCEEGNGELEINIPYERKVREYRKLDNTTRNANYAVQDLLKFNGKYLNTMECVILSPLTIGTRGY